jgi:hypothetical protein
MKRMNGKQGRIEGLEWNRIKSNLETDNWLTKWAPLTTARRGWCSCHGGFDNWRLSAPMLWLAARVQGGPKPAGVNQALKIYRVSLSKRQ